MRHIMALSFMVMQSIIAAPVLSFIPYDLENFITQIVTPDERNNFRRYYDKLSLTIGEDAIEQQRSTRRYFRQKALDFLKDHHNVLYEQVYNFLCDVAFLDQTYDKDREKLQSYLLWYGAYQEFDMAKKQVKKKVALSKDKAPEKNTVLESTTTIITEASELITDASDTVRGWFSFGPFRKNKHKKAS